MNRMTVTEARQALSIADELDAKRLVMTDLQRLRAQLEEKPIDERSLVLGWLPLAGPLATKVVAAAIVEAMNDVARCVTKLREAGVEPDKDPRWPT